MVSTLLLATAVLGAALVDARAQRLPDGRPNANTRPMAPMPRVPNMINGVAIPAIDKNGNVLPPTNTTYYFNQLIDHRNPKAGTFKQRYWSTWEYYEPGGCVVISTPGEANAQGYDGYLTNRTLNGQIAAQHNCATVVIEHRFFGESNPKPDLKSGSLKGLLTLEQAIYDLDYFAKNVKLPFKGGDNLHPDTTPWVISGGSYSGALVSWVMNEIDTFWAGYSSSGVVEAITDFWAYFEPIRTQMPKNCSSDVEKVITHIDTVFTFGKTSEKEEIKALFGLEDVEHLDDVSGALRNNLWDWQSIQPDSGPNTEFRKFCDALEVKSGVSAPAAGWGLDHALSAWGNYWKTYYLGRLCGDGDINACLTTYDSTQEIYTDTEVDNTYRAWTWYVCKEVGYFQDGAPLTRPSIVSRLVQPNDDIRSCSYYFPEEYKTALQKITPPNTIGTNIRYKGWNTNVDRVFFANANNDPWKEATVSAQASPYKNSTSRPVGVSNGYHCSDLLTRMGTADPTVKSVQQQGLAAMKRWIPTFKPKKAGGHPKGKRASENASEAAPVVKRVSERAPGRKLKPLNAFTGGLNPAFEQ